MAEWLTLRLTAAGYRVWCDRFKLLGGESWPNDIDGAIKNRTFRMLQLVSRHSLHKENPVKERQLALALQHERKKELFIPLNVDGLKATDLNWQISDIVWVPFEDWGIGLRQLLEKLEAVDAPRLLCEEGRGIAAAAVFPPRVTVADPELIVTNWFPFLAIPPVVKRFTTTFADAVSVSNALQDVWPHRRSGNTFLALVAPPAAREESNRLRTEGGASWVDVRKIDDVYSTSLVLELLNKSLLSRCLAMGLKQVRDGMVYFPMGLVPGERVRFAPVANPGSRRTHVRLWGRRKTATGFFRHHLGFVIKARRGVGDDIAARLMLRIHVTDENGEPAPPGRLTFRRSSRVRRSWLNRQQLMRQTAMMEFLSAGADRVPLGFDDGGEFALSKVPLTYEVPVRIDEGAGALAGEEPEALPEDTEGVDPESHTDEGADW